jgi:hypothetical protein
MKHPCPNCGEKTKNPELCDDCLVPSLEANKKLVGRLAAAVTKEKEDAAERTRRRGKK